MYLTAIVKNPVNIRNGKTYDPESMLCHMYFARIGGNDINKYNLTNYLDTKTNFVKRIAPILHILGNSSNTNFEIIKNSIFHRIDTYPIRFSSPENEMYGCFFFDCGNFFYFKDGKYVPIILINIKDCNKYQKYSYLLHKSSDYLGVESIGIYAKMYNFYAPDSLEVIINEDVWINSVAQGSKYLNLNKVFKHYENILKSQEIIIKKIEEDEVICNNLSESEKNVVKVDLLDKEKTQNLIREELLRRHDVIAEKSSFEYNLNLICQLLNLDPQLEKIQEEKVITTKEK